MGLTILEAQSYLPSRVITNQDMTAWLDTDDTWIRQRTGIGERHWGEENATELAVKSAQKLSEELLDKRIKMVIVATLSSDVLMPSVAAAVHHALGLEEAVFCLDINMACTGFVGALLLAEQGLKEGERAVVIGSEQLSEVTDKKDRSTAVLFGDGAGSVIVEKNNQPMQAVYGTRFSEDLLLHKKDYIRMDGRSVYRFATSLLPGLIEKVCENEQISLDDVDKIVLHQANVRIIEAVSQRLKRPISQFPMVIEKVANTSAASVALSLAQLESEAVLAEGSCLIVAGFGGGFTYCALLIYWKKERKNL